jgi:RNA polymerase sigma factor (sigma-70 family)
MPVSAVRVLRAIADEERTDAELLARFIDRRDEAAFALLVRRHGAMVYGVCRRLLPEPDAEDAFQATFLVLAQKARAAAPREVANWLYGVARRAALLSRRSIARRRERMGEVPERPASRSDELRAMLDEELSRLPDAYRTVIVLCDLEGRTRKVAVAMLGWPEGTVGSAGPRPGAAGEAARPVRLDRGRTGGHGVGPCPGGSSPSGDPGGGRGVVTSSGGCHDAREADEARSGYSSAGRCRVRDGAASGAGQDP